MGLKDIIEGAVNGEDESAVEFIRAGGREFVDSLYTARLVVSENDYMVLKGIVGQIAPVVSRPTIVYPYAPEPQPQPQPSLYSSSSGSKQVSFLHVKRFFNFVCKC